MKHPLEQNKLVSCQEEAQWMQFFPESHYGEIWRRTEGITYGVHRPREAIRSGAPTGGVEMHEGEGSARKICEDHPRYVQ